MKKAVCAAMVSSVLLSVSAVAHEQGDIVVRGGIASVVPNESSDNVLGLGEFDINSDTQLGLTVGYMFTDNISLEILAATPFKHDVSLNGVGTIAEVEHLPPTFMVQYYFGNKDSKLRPYVGAGLNFTTFFNEDLTNTGKAAGLSDLSLDDSWGLAANIGADYMLSDKLFAGASIWYADIGTDVKFKHNGNPQKIKTDIDPWVFMVSVGYEF
ncbi:outer membrane protein OmpW [Parasalinivibrio latis]|uniref:outer membrane protein OmpW n=1 Tax=Parasalinivibrio latis TaxID=2952610 RepID=UPI0030E3ADE8